MPSPRWIAFGGKRRIAHGAPEEVAARVKAIAEKSPNAQLLIFDAHSSRPVELDLRGSVEAVLGRLEHASGEATSSDVVPDSSAPRGPGRPRLGVVAREVTLLPRHWEWLASQPGGASVALRKLVERARRDSRESDRMREARKSVYRFMHAMAGDEPGFEEATRALFAGEPDWLGEHVATWPRDVRAHALALAELALPAPDDSAVESLP